MKTINKTTLFLSLTFIISFSLAGIYTQIVDDPYNKTAFTILGVIYMFIPTLCVILVKKVIHKEKLTKDLMISFKINKWFFVAWLIMPVISFSTVGISLLIFPNITYSPEMTGLINRFEFMLTPEQIEQAKKSLEAMPFNPLWMILTEGLLAGITVNAVAGFGEELGWRGFLLKEYKDLSFFKAALIIGFIWGFWHAPLILMGHNYPLHPRIGVLMMIILCILLSVLLIYITIKSRSVIATAIAHGTMNATAGISIMLVNGGNDLTTGIPGLAGFVTLSIFILLLFIYDYFISKDKILVNKISYSL